MAGEINAFRESSVRGLSPSGQRVQNLMNGSSSKERLRSWIDFVKSSYNQGAVSYDEAKRLVDEGEHKLKRM